MLMVDMALPRDIDNGIKELSDVYLYTLEDLAEITNENKQARLIAAKQAEQVIKIKADEYIGWLNSRRAKQIITDLLIEADITRASALEKAMESLRKGKPPEDVLSGLASSLTGKLVHPILKILSHASEQKKFELLDTIKKQLDDYKKPD